MTVNDPLPPGVAYLNTAQITAPAIGPVITFSDTFADAAYNNSYGSGDWTGDFWTEINDDSDSGAGKIQINNDFLVFRGTDKSDTFTVTRALNLAGAVNANLSFDYWEQGRLEDADQVTVSVRSGGAWHDLTHALQ